MAMPRSRQVSRQRFQPKGRSIFRPAPMSEMITTNSLRCSTTASSSLGCGMMPGRSGKAKISAPRATQKIGRDRGNCLRTIGSQAVSSTTTPNPARTTTYALIRQRTPLKTRQFRQAAG
jgi:hypothetical protein